MTSDADDRQLVELRGKIERGELPEDARSEGDARARSTRRDAGRLRRRHSMVRSYVEWLAELPWIEHDRRRDRSRPRASRSSTRITSTSSKVKDRILEFLAVQRLKQHRSAGPLICLVGPPGVGKTSIGRSIARATGREFVRVSLGGMQRRGRDPRPPPHLHRRDARPDPARACGAPAAPIRCSCSTRSTSSARDFRGDPAAALLEVLDPEQNNAFRDHYLDLPFDLSRGAVHRDRERPRHDPRAAARSHGDHRAPRLHRARTRSQIAKRYLMPKQVAEARPRADAARVHRRRDARS